MVDKRFCDWCGKDITDSVQQELSMRIRTKPATEFMEAYTAQLCESCGAAADQAIDKTKRDR